MSTEFGKRLRAARNHANLTQKGAAKLTGIAQSTISTAEREGESSTEVTTYALAYGVNAHWLATGQGSMLEPNFEPRTYTAAAVEAAEKAIFTLDTSNVDEVGRPARLVRTPVVGTARMGEDGYYEEIDYPVGHGDGHVDSYSSDPNVYALRVKGDSMHPAIRHGSFVVVEPNGRCVPGEYIVLALRDGQKMVKELVIERPHEIVIESVNGNHRKTIDRTDIEKMHPVAAIVSASKWRES